MASLLVALFVVTYEIYIYMYIYVFDHELHCCRFFFAMATSETPPLGAPRIGARAGRIRSIRLAEEVQG